MTSADDLEGSIEITRKLTRPLQLKVIKILVTPIKISTQT